MDFDFTGLYKSYSTIELLKIVRQPANYQEAAVQAAIQILEGRNASDEEKIAAGFIIEKPESNTARLSAPHLPGAAADLLNDFDPDAAAEKNKKWFIAFFAFLVLCYLPGIWYSIRNIFRIIEYNYYEQWPVIYHLLYFAVIPVSLIGFYKKNKVAWFIILGETVLSFCMSMYYLIKNFDYFSVFRPELLYFFIPLLSKPVIIWFLAQKKLTDLFKISEPVRRKTFYILLALAFGAGIIWYITYSGTPM